MLIVKLFEISFTFSAVSHSSTEESVSLLLQEKSKSWFKKALLGLFVFRINVENLWLKHRPNMNDEAAEMTP